MEVHESSVVHPISGRRKTDCGRIIQQSLRPTYRHCTRALKKKAKCMRQDALDPTGSFVPTLGRVFGYKVCSEIPPRRISSAGGTPVSACFRTATVCSTLNCFLFHRESPFLGCYIGVENQPSKWVKKDRGVSLGGPRILLDQARDRLLDDWNHPRAHLAVACAN